jgi:hypothetical protein
MKWISGVFLVFMSISAQAQGFDKKAADNGIAIDTTYGLDTSMPVLLKEIDIVRFKNKDEEMEYWKTLSRVRKVMPYVKIAKQLYVEMTQKEEGSKKREFKKYRKDVEKEMRSKFEAELKNLSVNQGKVLVKLINRETGNNCFSIIKGVKGGFSAFVWQIVAKRYDYDLKEQYDPNKEKMIELVIRQLGKEYNV